jgi:hypothetical protein
MKVAILAWFCFQSRQMREISTEHGGSGYLREFDGLDDPQL